VYALPLCAKLSSLNALKRCRLPPRTARGALRVEHWRAEVSTSLCGTAPDPEDYANIVRKSPSRNISARRRRVPLGGLMLKPAPSLMFFR